MQRVEHDLAVVYVDPATLEHWPGNANKGDVPHIKSSMRDNGVFAPLTVQTSTNRIIIGNHRFLALKELWDEEPARWPRRVPVMFLDVDDARANRINLEDNKARDRAVWDDRALLDQLGTLYEDDMGTLAGSGFTDDEYTRMLLAADTPPPPPPADKGLDVQNGTGLQLGSEPGDIEPLGDNTKATPAAKTDWRLMVYCESETARDDLLADLRARGENASAVG